MMGWTIALAAAVTAAIDEAGKHRVTLAQARRRILHRIEREAWKQYTGRHATGPSAPPNRHARRRAARQARA